MVFSINDTKGCLVFDLSEQERQRTDTVITSVMLFQNHLNAKLRCQKGVYTEESLLFFVTWVLT